MTGVTSHKDVCVGGYRDRDFRQFFESSVTLRTAGFTLASLHADVRKLPTWGGMRDKPKNVCVGG